MRTKTENCTLWHVSNKFFNKELIMNKGNTVTPSSESSQAETVTDALKLLKADHDKVKKLFKEFDKLVEENGSAKQKGALAQEICHELTVHARIEEEAFYPALRKGIEKDDLVDEALVEHATVKDLIEQISSASRKNGMYDAKVKVLGEYVSHHVKEEESEIFSEAKKAGLDLDKLGKKLVQLKSKYSEELEASAA